MEDLGCRGHQTSLALTCSGGTWRAKGYRPFPRQPGFLYISLTLTLALALAPALNLTLNLALTLTVTLTLTLTLALALALHQGEH